MARGKYESRAGPKYAIPCVTEYPSLVPFQVVTIRKWKFQK